MKRLTQLAWTLVIAIVAVAISVPTLALAQGGGAVRHAQAAKKHKTKKKTLTGPRGPQGARGPQGQPGPQGPGGPKGANGATSVVARVGANTLLDGQTSATVTASCQTGERATGGGGEAFGFGAGPDLTLMSRSVPTPTSDGATPTGWSVRFTNTAAAGTTAVIHAYAICASP